MSWDIMRLQLPAYYSLLGLATRKLRQTLGDKKLELTGLDQGVPGRHSIAGLQWATECSFYTTWVSLLGALRLEGPVDFPL